MSSITKIPRMFHQTYRPMFQCAFNPSPLQISLPLYIHRRALSLSTRTKKQKPKKKKSKRFRAPNLGRMQQFSLCDAMRYIRAFEVGRSPDSSKYELAIRIRSRKDGPVVRNRIRLPHAVGANYKIGVICPSPSPIATAALAAGASVCGEESLVETILLSGKKLPFDRLLCHVDSVDKLNKSGLGKVLGPRKMMPSAKLGTVTDDVPKVVSNIIGASEYREKIGVIRCAVGKLVFTPQQLNTNIRVIMESVKRDMHDLSDQILKEIHEVVLSSTNSPGFSLNGNFKSEKSVPERDLTII